ncbi:unnamed protein product [Victoria cruziana]
MGPLATYRSLLLLSLLGSLICASSAQTTCRSQNFANNRIFQTCMDLPVLNAFLHWTYFPSNGTVNIAYKASPSVTGGWVSWAINPTGTGMIGSQAIVGYVVSGQLKVITTSITTMSPSMQNESLSFPISNLAGETSGNDIILFATLTPRNGSTVNQVWQTGPVSGGIPAIHPTSGANIRSMASLDLQSGQSTSTGGGNSRARRKNVHGVLNAVSWGILMPIGIIIARYMRVFKSADPAWFYLHVTCQCSAYILGVAGWGTGMKLGSESQGVQYSDHRNIGITLFCLGTLQVFALFLRPKKDHKYRIYWNFYHHSVGYTIIILSIINIFKGLQILSEENKWKNTYIGILVVLAAIAIVLEIFTWIVVLRRRFRNSEKSHHGANGTNGYGVRSSV